MRGIAPGNIALKGDERLVGSVKACRGFDDFRVTVTPFPGLGPGRFSARKTMSRPGMCSVQATSKLGEGAAKVF